MSFESSQNGNIMGLLSSIVSFVLETKWLYLFNRSRVRVSSKSMWNVAKNVKIENCTFIVTGNSVVTIEDGAYLKNSIISVDNANFIVGRNSIVGSRKKVTEIHVQNSCSFTLGHHSLLLLKRIWIRFAGCVKIGDYTNINYDSEIRSDESVTIGSYCQISYGINIWDTNTHNILPPEERKVLAEKYYPYFGFETTRPKTAPVVVGDYCWLGEKSTLLKGTRLGNNVIVGYNTTLPGLVVEDNKCVVTDIKLRIL